MTDETERRMTVERITLKDNERIDDLQRNNLKIIQDPNRFCFGMDAVLLTGFVGELKGESLLDLGTGTGIIPILLSAKTECKKLIGLEIQKDSADMAQRSVGLNSLEDRIEIVEGDIKKADEMFAPSSFDYITCNPPYMIGKHGIVNPESPKAIARHEILCDFEDIARVSAKLLKPNGKLFLVHRPFRLSEIFVTLTRYGLEPKRLRLVYPFADHEPNMALIEAVRGGKKRMTVEKPLIIFKEKDIYTDEVEELYGF